MYSTYGLAIALVSFMVWNIFNLLVICQCGVVAILYRNYLLRNFERNPSEIKPTFRDIDFDTLYRGRG
jgi:uncharacterized BrkB/YihY/UPF0761 family membrane protein